MQLRPHQEQAIQSMLDNDKGQVIVPTGGGKTICMIMDTIKQFTLKQHGLGISQTFVVVALAYFLQSNYVVSSGNDARTRRCYTYARS